MVVNHYCTIVVFFVFTRTAKIGTVLIATKWIGHTSARYIIFVIMSFVVIHM